MDGTHVRREMQRAFRQVALTLGGIFDVYKVDDDVVWAITRNLDRIFGGCLRSSAGGSVAAEQRQVSGGMHVALRELLARIDADPPRRALRDRKRRGD